MQLNPHRSKLLMPLLVLIILVMMVQNYFLVRKNDLAQKRIAQLLDEVNKRSVISNGQQMAAFEGVNLDSQRVIIDLQSGRKKKLLFVFAASCGACSRNMDQWNWIVENTNPGSAEIIGLCADSLNRIREYFNKVRVSFRVFSLSINPSVLTKYKFLAVPQTVLVDSAGVVINVWTGVLSNEKREEIQKSV